MGSQMKNTDYQAIAAEKKAQQCDKIPQDWRIPADKFYHSAAASVMDVPLACGLLSETEARITSDYDATALLGELKAGVWSAEQVVVAFCKRAAIAQQLTNCLTEIFFDEAIARAKKLDQEYGAKLSLSRGGKPLPPLFGLPISLKDCFQVRGHDTSTGVCCFVGEPAAEHSALAALLVDLGAVLYCKTNVPQSMMTGDSDNNVFGRTLNPRNRLLTAGGSTGGEGALLALRGSILGVGTDIAGSIRIPALCNGIYGFRPSVGLVPHSGVRDLGPSGTDGVHSSAGPMATSLRDCGLFLKAVMGADAWRYDSAAVAVPWVDNVQQQQQRQPGGRKLRIGVALTDGVFTPSPPVRRGLKQAVDLLRGDSSVEVIPINLPDVELISQDLISYVTLSGSDHYYEQFARTGEPPIPSLQAGGLLSVPGTTLQVYFELNARRAAAAKKYLALFRDNDLDAILMPPAAHTALPLDLWTKATYTGLWNYLDYPAVVMPVDRVRPDVDVADDVSNAKFGPDDEQLYSLYTGPEQYEDAPVSVQLVGYRHRDEALVKVAAALDSIINKKGI
ncbi:amidase signature domain-containing protein [Lasiosphaeria miniovina]|uniref:Amidase signature domain-containing protein n=1 Tax=Lasiosphaeria miniovina TaxID=1954250 RepID=A0AA40BG67_9PEZI|nr:amidase signature domain-containing protein [Lasiosphaeria miniovina]KAK0733619.1 amidase signature domain-containing protein [Lasiosphaeria miniovina]